MAISFLNQTQTANNYILFTGVSTVYQGAGGFSFWFYPTVVSGSKAILSLYNSSDGSTIKFSLDSSTSKFVVSTYFSFGSYSMSSLSNYNLNSWNHVFLIQTGSSTLEVFLNDDAGSVDTEIYGPFGIDRILLGAAYDYNTSSIVPEFEGRIAEIHAFFGRSSTPTINPLKQALYKGINYPLVKSYGSNAYALTYIPCLREAKNLRGSTSTVVSTGTNISAAPHVRRYG